jgi:hypothetical protein
MKIFWFRNSYVNFKSWFQTFTFYLVIVTILSYFNIQDVILIIKQIIFLYITLILLLIVVSPEVKYLFIRTWCGITSYKNELEQVGIRLTIPNPIIFNFKTKNK